MPLTATKSIVINAPASRVWEALTDPAQVKQVIWGSEVVSDWKQGSPLIYRGVWEGKPFEDKVMALTPAQVNEALRKYLDPSKVTVIKAGDFSKK